MLNTGGDTFHFDITGASLATALGVATTWRRGTAAWKLDHDGKRMVLYWTLAPDTFPLPATLDGQATVGLVESWLATVDYGPEPDLDGSVGKGVRVYNERWGNVGDEWQAFAAIEPVWLEYHK